MMLRLALRVSWVCLLMSFGVCVPVSKSDYKYPYVVNDYSVDGPSSGPSSLQHDEPQDQSPVRGVQGAGSSPSFRPTAAAEPAYVSWYRVPDTRVDEAQYSPPEPSYPTNSRVTVVSPPAYEPQYSPPAPSYPTNSRVTVVSPPAYEPQYSPPAPSYPADTRLAVSPPIYEPKVSTPVHTGANVVSAPVHVAPHYPEASYPANAGGYDAGSSSYALAAAPGLPWFGQPDLNFLSSWRPSASFPDFSAFETEETSQSLPSETSPLPPASYIIQSRNGYVRAKEVHSHSKYTHDFGPYPVNTPSKTSVSVKGPQASW